MPRSTTRKVERVATVRAPKTFASTVRDVSRTADKLGAEAMLVDVTPATALALPSVIVVFAAMGDQGSLTMVERVTSAAAHCGRAVGVVPPIAVMDAGSDGAVALAEKLGLTVRGPGETCWLARGFAVAQTDVLVEDQRLVALAMALVRNTAD